MIILVSGFVSDVRKSFVNRLKSHALKGEPVYEIDGVQRVYLSRQKSRGQKDRPESGAGKWCLMRRGD